MKTFVTADTHFGHKNIVKFTRDDGSKLRPWDDVEAMNRDMAEMWNATVKPDDLVYVLGDFVINRRHLPIAGELNGRKILVKGNHDVFRLEEYSQYFQDVRACVVLQRAILTHIPVHPAQLERFHHNVHGHLHSHVVTKEVEVETGIGMMAEQVPDSRYTCVSVEHTDFKPILLSTVLENIE